MNKIDTESNSYIKEKIKELEQEVEELKPNGSCKNVKRDIETLLARIQKIKQQHQEI